MSRNWFYADRSNQQQGPVGDDWLIAAARRGEITPTTLVWHEGLPSWVAFAQVAAQLGLATPGVPPVLPARAPVRVAKSGGSKTWVIVLVVVAFGLVAILGILAAIAIPAYQDFVVRSKIAGAHIQARQLQGPVVEFRQQNSRCPVNGEAGSGAPESYATEVIETIHIDGPDNGRCAIRVVFKDLGARRTAGAHLTLALDGDGNWQSSSSLPDRYLPVSLRSRR